MFEKLCKEKLAEELLEKKHRAERFSFEKARLGQACLKKRAVFKGFI